MKQKTFKGKKLADTATKNYTRLNRGNFFRPINLSIFNIFKKGAK